METKLLTTAALAIAAACAVYVGSSTQEEQVAQGGEIPPWATPVSSPQPATFHGRETAENVDRMARADSPKAVETIFNAALANPGQEEAILHAFRVLPVQNTKSLEAVASILVETGDATALRAASETLARGAVTDTVDYLHELYVEEEHFTGQRAGILAAIRGIRNEPAADGLGALLDSSDERLREAAAIALRDIATEAAIELLATRAANEDQALASRELLLAQLAAIRDPRASEAIQKVSEHLPDGAAKNILAATLTALRE